MKTELRMPEEGPQVSIHPDGLKATLIYYSLISCGTFPNKQKGCSKRTRGV